MFVGNIDKTIPNEELKKYFLNLYTSIISVKIIFDQETGKSKGFGFVEFTNYREFNKALNISISPGLVNFILVSEPNE